MQATARKPVRPLQQLAARVSVRHHVTEASNLYYPGQRAESAPLWRGMGRSEHVDVAHALVQSLGAGLEGYALSGGEPTLNRPALLELVHYLASAALRSFWLRTRQGELAEGMPALRSAMASSRNTLIESNSVLNFLRPDLYLFVLDHAIVDLKDSARRFLARADVLVTLHEDKPAPWPGVPARWRRRSAHAHSRSVTT